MLIELHPSNIFKKHIAFIVFLLITNSLGIVSKLFLEDDYFYGFVPLFDMNAEANIPTLFSSVMMLVCSCMLYLIAKHHRKENLSFIPWYGLSLIFLFLAIDETYSIHESFSESIHVTYETSGFFYYAWVIPYAVVVLIFLSIYAKFLLSLPKKIMLLFMFSGFVFVSGAIGFEMLGGQEAESYGNQTLVYSIYFTCEETLEMLGIAIFLYTILLYIVSHMISLTIKISDK